MEQQNQHRKEHHMYSDSMELTIDIQWHDLQSKIDFKPKVVESSSFINGDDNPAEKVFNLSWSTKEKQTTSWSQQWDIVKNFERTVKSPDPSCTLTISYDYISNPSTASVPLSLNKSAQKTVAPRKTAIVNLELLTSGHIDLYFTATIKCYDVNNRSAGHKRDLEGCWSGTLYNLSSSYITLKQTELGIL